MNSMRFSFSLFSATHYFNIVRNKNILFHFTPTKEFFKVTAKGERKYKRMTDRKTDANSNQLQKTSQTNIAEIYSSEMKTSNDSLLKEKKISNKYSTFTMSSPIARGDGIDKERYQSTSIHPAAYSPFGTASAWDHTHSPESGTAKNEHK